MEWPICVVGAFFKITGESRGKIVDRG